MLKTLFFDCEIAKCIPDKYCPNNPRYEYCQGWTDFKGMGVAIVCAYASWSGYHSFVKEDLPEFQKLVNEADKIVGFNSISFDDNLLTANGIEIATTYDLLCETRVASGQPPHYTPGETRGGYALEQLARANLGRGKTGKGELAPRRWQEGRYKEVVEYCFNDLGLLRELYERKSALTDPTNGSVLFLRGGDRCSFLKYSVRSWLQEKRENWRTSDLRVFLWAIARTDISGCRIFIQMPIAISWHISWCNLVIRTEFRIPKIDFFIPYETGKEFEKATGEEIYPF